MTMTMTMAMQRPYADHFAVSFLREAPFMDFLRERETNAAWKTGKAKDLQIAALAEDEYMMPELWEDTMQNTGLLLMTAHQDFPVRSCAVKTLLDRAGIKSLTGLLEIEIRNPVNCLLGVCKRVGITKKLAYEAAQAFVDHYGDGPCTAHDVYYGINETVFLLQCDGATGSRVVQAEETVARALSVRWSDYDIPGELKW